MEEDNLLKQKYIELKGKWSEIRKHVRGRTDVQLKYRFSVLERRGEIRSFQYEYMQNEYNCSISVAANPIQKQDLNVGHHEFVSKAVEIKKEKEAALEKASEDISFNIEGFGEIGSVFDNVDFDHENSEQLWEFGIFPNNLW
jgi:hypothetical protein